MVELESLAIVPVVALKVAVVAAAATVTEPGSVSVALVLVSFTLAPPAGALPALLLAMSTARCDAVPGGPEPPLPPNACPAHPCERFALSVHSPSSRRLE